MGAVRAITGCVHEWTHTTFPDGGVRLACRHCAGREFVPPPPAGRSVVAYPDPEPVLAAHLHLEMGGRCGVCFEAAVASPCDGCRRANAGARRAEGWDPPTRYPGRTPSMPAADEKGQTK